MSILHFSINKIFRAHSTLIFLMWFFYSFLWCAMCFHYLFLIGARNVYSLSNYDHIFKFLYIFAAASFLSFFYSRRSLYFINSWIFLTERANPSKDLYLILLAFYIIIKTARKFIKSILMPTKICCLLENLS